MKLKARRVTNFLNTNTFGSIGKSHRSIDNYSKEYEITQGNGKYIIAALGYSMQGKAKVGDRFAIGIVEFEIVLCE